MPHVSRVVLIVLLLLTLPLTAEAWNRGRVETFAALPSDTHHPEGITVDSRGNVYVTTFDITKSTGPGTLLVFRPNGSLLRRVAVTGSTNLLLDLAFHPMTRQLLVIDFGGKKVFSLDPRNNYSSSVFTTIPGGAAAGPNVLTFDREGNVYISDSFQGTIWRTPPTGALIAMPWKTDPLLQTSGVPPFGANGLAFNNNQSALFVANTGNDTVVKITVSGSPLVAGDAEVFVNSINGADGLIIDRHDNLWVAANQADEIVVVDPDGRAIAKLGDFNGLDRRGAPKGLLFPASLVRSGEFIYVTNLSLDLRLFGLAQTVDSQWAADVQRHTIARIPARIPRVSGLPTPDDEGNDDDD